MIKERIERDRATRTLHTMDMFVNKCLNLQPHTDTLSGYHYTFPLVYAATAHTYVETITTMADSLHRAIKMSTIKDIALEYLETVKIVGKRVELEKMDVILAFDVTEEEYYGRLETPYLHTWTGENGVTGKFKFLTCAIVCSKAPLKVPVFSVPVKIGEDIATVVIQVLALVRQIVGNITLILFDRGFYAKNLMLALEENNYPYLIFVPKNEKIKKELDSMCRGERKTVLYEFKLNKDKTTKRGKTTLAFLKQIYAGKSNREYDWSFATNKKIEDIDELVKEYKKRWRIETMFRVQDEARILSKSKDIRIRYFYFMYSQMLLLLWAGIFKEKLGFKEFLLVMTEYAKMRAEKEERKMQVPPWVSQRQRE